MSEERPFSGQLLHVWGREPFKGGLLANARLQDLGGRTFVMGTVKSKDARDGLIMWIPMEGVTGLVEYPDTARADVVSAEYKEYHRKKAKRGWWRFG